MNVLEGNPLTPFLMLVNARNQAADAFFYDVGALAAKEWLALKPWVNCKGTVIVVSPGDSKRPDTVRPYKHTLEFLNREGHLVDAIAVAGVGSSVVGTAALARSVADTYRCEVAGIVTGYGLADVVLEGLGGWYFYGKIDQLRYELERGASDLGAVLSQVFSKGIDPNEIMRSFDFRLDDYVPPTLDVSALNDVLLARYWHRTRPRMRLRLLVGHSKGNLLISSALNHMCHELRGLGGDVPGGLDDPFNSLAVVTLGAVVDLPEALIKPENQYQLLGSLDLLGRVNSRSIAGNINRAIMVDGAGHHLNRKIPAHLDVAKELKKHLPTLPHLEGDDGDGRVLSLRGLDRKAGGRQRATVPAVGN
jgi:hypothetical protein